MKRAVIKGRKRFKRLRWLRIPRWAQAGYQTPDQFYQWEEAA